MKLKVFGCHTRYRLFLLCVWVVSPRPRVEMTCGGDRLRASFYRRPASSLSCSVYAVYAISSLDTGVPLRPHPKATIVGTYQGVAGLAPRPFTLGEETGSHHVFMFIAPASSHCPLVSPGLFSQREGPGSEPGNSLVRPDGHV